MIIHVDSSEIDEFYPNVIVEVLDCQEEFQEFAATVIHESGRLMPQNPTEALVLYLFLLQKINEHS